MWTQTMSVAHYHSELKEGVVAEDQRQRKTQEKRRLKKREDKNKEEKEQHYN